MSARRPGSVGCSHSWRWSGRYPRVGALPFAKVLLVVALGVLGVALLVACSPAPDSGITGTVTIGPTQPVSTPGTPDSEPYSAELMITPEGGAHLKPPTKVTSAEDGSFQVNLEPGTYVIQSASTESLPSLAPLTVVVEPNAFTPVEVVFDSGIR